MLTAVILLGIPAATYFLLVALCGLEERVNRGEGEK